MDYLGFDEVRYGADMVTLIHLKFEASELRRLVEGLYEADLLPELHANLREILEAVEA